NLQTDDANCGVCGVKCAMGQMCAAGNCAATCAAPLVVCNNGCVDPRFDPMNCGGCFKACAVGPNAIRFCNNGVCGLACNNGFGDCDGNGGNGCEIDLRSDVNNCGLCGRSCNGMSCTNGNCAAALAGQYD